MSETALLKSRKWKKFSFGETFEQMTSHSYWACTAGTVVRSRGFQFSGGRSRVGSRNPRNIGMGVPYILGFVERGCRKMGVPIFL